jgi:hypothetical protein
VAYACLGYRVLPLHHPVQESGAAWPLTMTCAWRGRWPRPGIGWHLYLAPTGRGTTELGIGMPASRRRGACGGPVC